MRDIADLTKFTPSLHQSSGFAGGNNNVQFFLRGVGQIDYLPTTDPGVGVYVDGVFVARATGNLLDLAGIEQIEVLRGPQGVLFGKNTMGGAITIATRRPGGEREGRADVTVGSRDRLDLRGEAYFPIADTLSGSISAVRYRQDGYGKSLITGVDYGNRNADAVRGALDWRPTPDLEVYLTADYTRRREDTRPVYLQQVFPVSSTSAVPNYLRLTQGGAVLDGRYIAASEFDSFTNTDSRNDLDVGGVSAIVDWKFGDISLKSISAYRNQRFTVGVDQDATPFEIGDQTRAIDADQASQEFQLSGNALGGRLDWVAGTFFLKEDSTTKFDRRFFVGLFEATGTTDNENFTRTAQQSESASVFAHGALALTQRVKLSAGLRYSHEEKDAQQISFFKKRNISAYRGPGNTVLPSLAEISATDTWDSLTPRVSLDFKPADEVLLYVSYARGFKSGGFDGRPIGNIGAPNPFDEEVLDSYEIGAKLDLLDRRLRLNGAAYQGEYKDLQLSSNFADPVSGVPRTATINAGKAEVQGFELEAVALPVAALRLVATTSYTDFEFKELPPGNAFPLSDQPQEVPKWQWSVGARYTVNLAGGAELAFDSSYSYRTKYYNELANGGVVFGSTVRQEFPTSQDGYGLLDARITYTDSQDRWALSLFGTNLTDERYKAGGFSNLAQGISIAYYGAPREWGLSLQRKF